MYSGDPHPVSHVFGVFRGNGETPSLAFSDSDSLTEASSANRNYESDSNWSGDLDNANMEDFAQENVNSDSNMEPDVTGSENEG